MMLSIFSQLIFGNSNAFNFGGSARSGSSGGSSGGVGSGTSTWKDKSLCFDLKRSDLDLLDGEQLIACFFPIEDIKGNQDELGLLKVTNLRLIWINCNKKRVNLSIGWRTITLTFEQNLKDSLGSSFTSLCVLCKYEATKYEFVFNKMSAYNADFWSLENNEQLSEKAMSILDNVLKNVNDNKSLLITHLTPMYLAEPYCVVFKVWQSYKKTSLFRHCRANLTHLLTDNSNGNPLNDNQQIRDGEINKLPSEEIIDIYKNIVQCETRSIRYPGIIVLTSVRLIWIDQQLVLRNLSIPYLRIESIRLKQNDKIVINTLDYLATSNRIELTFERASKQGAASIDDSSRLKLIYEQVQNLFTLYKSKPKFGPESCEDSLNFMTYLRPIGNYTYRPENAPPFINNFGPETNTSQSYVINTKQDTSITDGTGHKLKSWKVLDADTDIDQNESELDRYTEKLYSYLNEQSNLLNKNLIYYEGELSQIDMHAC